MNRRTALKALAAIPVVSLLPRFLSAARSVNWRRARPSSAAWPEAADWRKLHAAVNGNLIEVPPLLSALSKDSHYSASALSRKDLLNPFYLGDQPAGTQVSGWLEAWTPAPSVYAVRAQTGSDVAAAVNFAREHRLRLVVKGTGHSYQGTSNAPDSLLVWTRQMNRVTLHDAFVPQGRTGQVVPVPAVTAEAGAVWIDVYHAVTTEAGRYVQGGGCTDVGVAGLIQSGGFGSFSKGFGTAAAGLLEAEIVTADGQVKVVNDQIEPDLFWAIKGGGGGTFGVVTKLTLRTHELPEYFGSAWGQIGARSDAAFRKLIARFMAFYRDQLCNPHWGESVEFRPDNTLAISMVCQGLDPAQVAKTWEGFFGWVKASPQDFTVLSPLQSGAGAARGWWDVSGNKSMIPDPRAGAPSYHGWWKGDQGQVGAFIHGFESLWLPASLLPPGRQPLLVDGLFAASRYTITRLHFNKGLAGARADVRAAARQTATNPAMIDAFALILMAEFEGPAYPGLDRPPIDLSHARRDVRQVDLGAAALRKLAPNAGSYVSESNYFNPAWPKEFWGENYPRLRFVKQHYDPEGLFFVHHGVGSEEWSADGFTRISAG